MTETITHYDTEGKQRTYTIEEFQRYLRSELVERQAVKPTAQSSPLHGTPKGKVLYQRNSTEKEMTS